jgi:hypothetical protein
MHRNGALDGSERRPCVATHPLKCVDNNVGDLVSDLLQVVNPLLAMVWGRVDLG